MAANHQKKAGGGMYVYNMMGTKASTHKPPELNSSRPMTLKQAMSRGYWGRLRRSKTVVREVDINVDGGRGHHCKVVGEEARRSSVSSEKEAAAAAGGRKSVSHIEVNVASMAAFLQVKVLVTDMPRLMQVHAFRCARKTYDSLEKFSSKHMAFDIKREFDKVYGPAWHCIVGTSFGSYVTHSTGCFLYFSMENLYILVFRTKVQKASDD